MPDVAAIILAAGRSTRFSGRAGAATKLVATLDGKPLVRHVAEAALLSSARPVIAVTGHQGARVEDALRGLDVAYVDNPDYASGLASSLRRGVDAAPAASAGALILLGDMPLVSGALMNRLIAAFECDAASAGPRPLAVAPLRDGRRGNPVLIGRALFAAVATLAGDRGARDLVEAAGDRVMECIVEDDAALIDVDTEEALERLRER